MTWTDGHPQRWAWTAAWGVLACAVPSALWRLLMIAGLSVAQLAAAVLVVGLVRPWGERFLGVPIHRWVPVALGTLGGLTMTWLFSVQLFIGILAGGRPDQDTVHGIPLVVMYLAYAPMVLFGPLTLAAVVGCARRRGTGRRVGLAQRAT